MSLVPRGDLGFDFVDLGLYFVDRAAKIIGDVNNRRAGLVEIEQVLHVDGGTKACRH